MDVRCWWCGVEPVVLFDVTTFASPEPQYLPQWPAGTDHEHAEKPPTPGEMLAAGGRSFDRLIGDALS